MAIYLSFDLGVTRQKGRVGVFRSYLFARTSQKG
jgi:hypothetical protein